MALIGSPGDYQSFLQSGGLQYAIGLLAQAGGVGSSPPLAVAALAGQLRQLQPYLSPEQAMDIAQEASAATLAGGFYREGTRRTPIAQIPVQTLQERLGASSGQAGRYLYRVLCQPANNPANLGTTVWVSHDTQATVEDVLAAAEAQAGQLRESQQGSESIQLGLVDVQEWDCTVEAVTRSY